MDNFRSQGGGSGPGVSAEFGWALGEWWVGQPHPPGAFSFGHEFFPEKAKGYDRSCVYDCLTSGQLNGETCYLGTTFYSCKIEREEGEILIVV